MGWKSKCIMAQLVLLLWVSQAEINVSPKAYVTFGDFGIGSLLSRFRLLAQFGSLGLKDWGMFPCWLSAREAGRLCPRDTYHSSSSCPYGSTEVESLSLFESLWLPFCATFLIPAEAIFLLLRVHVIKLGPQIIQDHLYILRSITIISAESLCNIPYSQNPEKCGHLWWGFGEGIIFLLYLVLEIIFSLEKKFFITVRVFMALRVTE